MPEVSTARKQIGVRSGWVLGAALIACASLAPPADAQEQHPLLNSKYWAKAGVYFASRSSGLSASGTFNGETVSHDWEKSTGLDDTSDLFAVEFGWQFAEKWDFALQHWRSSRSNRRELSDSIEWEDITYEVGAVVDTHMGLEITRLFFSRRFWDKGPHDLRIGAGLHLINAGVSISGEATLDDMSTSFEESVVSAKFPFPDIGVWYRYSISDRWLLHTRVDWLSASTSDYAGGIWNVAAGIDYSLTKHLGLGLAYQFFELSGTVKEDTWRGELTSTFAGFMLSVDGFW